MNAIKNLPIIDSLPMKSGVSPSKVYLPKNTTYTSVFDYLCVTFCHISRQCWQERFADGQIFAPMQDKFVVLNTQSSYQTFQDGYIYYYRSLKKETPVPFAHHVIFENERLMVVDKPHFLTMTPAGNYVKETLLSRLKDETNNSELSPIHRLDKDTAGLVLFCKDKKYRSTYQSLFDITHHNHSIKKIYHAIAPFKKELILPMTLNLHIERGDPFYTMKVSDGVPNSQTVIDIVDKKDNFAKYQLIPITGKLHQLRVHLNHLGIAIKNDPFYPSLCHRQPSDFDSPLQLLSKYIYLVDPVDNADYFFKSKRELIL